MVMCICYILLTHSSTHSLTHSQVHHSSVHLLILSLNQSLILQSAQLFTCTRLLSPLDRTDVQCHRSPQAHFATCPVTCSIITQSLILQCAQLFSCSRLLSPPSLISLLRLTLDVVWSRAHAIIHSPFHSLTFPPT